MTKLTNDEMEMYLMFCGWHINHKTYIGRGISCDTYFPPTGNLGHYSLEDAFLDQKNRDA
jgi:hypothetical protein